MNETVWEAYETGGARPRRLPNLKVVSDEHKPLKLHPARLPNPRTIQPRQWLYGTQLIRGYVTVLVAPGGTGKSVYAMGVGLSLAANKSLLGEHIFAGVNAAIFNLEDPMEELERRLAALMIKHGIGDSEVAGRLFMDTGEERGLTMAAFDDDGFTIVSPDEAALIAEIQENNIGVLICDPYAESHTLEENSNPHMVKAAAAWRRVARATNCAVLLVHHVRKGDVSGIDAARGAKALTDSARVGLVLSAMSKEEGEEFNVLDADRWSYVRLDDAKVNLAPKAGKARWFKLEQVALGNVTDDYPGGDKVAAIVQWKPPEITTIMSNSQLNEALDAMADAPSGQLYSSTKRGRENHRWAGQALVSLGASEKQAQQLINAWLKSGLLYPEEYRDDEQRKYRTGVKVDDSRRPTI